MTRGIGLMFRKGLPQDGGLIIQPCKGVVSFFMRFPIDVVFVDRDGRVVYLLKNMVPWRSSKIIPSARMVVELPTGTIDATGTQEGDEIRIAPA